MPIYMQYDTIKGDVTEEGHVGWVELKSFQWGLGRGISSPTGASADRESSAPSISEIIVTKDADASTPDLLNEALQGEGKKVQIDFCKTDKGKMEVYTTYTLTNCMISGHSTSSGGDRPTESLSLNFTKFEVKNTGAKASGEEGQPKTTTYDIGQAKVV